MSKKYKFEITSELKTKIADQVQGMFITGQKTNVFIHDNILVTLEIDYKMPNISIKTRYWQCVKEENDSFNVMREIE